MARFAAFMFMIVLIFSMAAQAEEVFFETDYLPGDAAPEIMEDGTRRYESAQTGEIWIINEIGGFRSGTFELTVGEDFSAAEFISGRWEDTIIIRDNENGLVFMARKMAGVCVVEEGVAGIEITFGEYMRDGRLTQDGALRALEMCRPNCTVTEIELDNDDGLMIYEGEALSDGIEYEFELDAQTGRLLEWDRD